jgi:hypothetical protein
MPPTPEEQEKITRRQRALDARPWARAQVDRMLAERRAQRAEAWFRALVEQELVSAEHSGRGCVGLGRSWPRRSAVRTKPGAPAHALLDNLFVRVHPGT